MRILVADVGYGTTDILVFDTESAIENCPKFVIPSRTQQLARGIREATGEGRAVVMDGVTMGGGPVGRALKEHLEAKLPFLASPDAALTFNDDLDKVRGWGVTIEDEPITAAPATARRLTSGDIDLETLLSAMAGLGIVTDFDGAAVAVQDHGFAPGRSNRRFRFAQWRELLARDNHIDSLAFNADAIPGHYTRMRATASLVSSLGDVIVMDTGPAALRGASSINLETLPASSGIVANCGNGHTLAAIISNGRIMGLAEHHTGLLDGPGFTRMMREFTDGSLTDSSIFEQGGHGCLPPEGPFSIEEYGPIIVTGPQRERFRESGLPLDFAAPYGDMMLTGCFGLAGAWLRLA